MTLDDVPTVSPVGTLHQVLDAVSDPIRLEMVRRLALADDRVACADLYENINKSTASHHFKVLREAGLIERSYDAGQSCQHLRVDEVEAVYPGVLASIVNAVTA